MDIRKPFESRERFMGCVFDGALTSKEAAAAWDVIEAAKAWWDDDDRSPKYAQFLGLAVEALQEVE